MPDLSVARHLPGARLPQALSGGERTKPAWWPIWSVPAGLRMLRAVLVIPSLFALTFEGFGNLQMALFAAFGGFASLVMASFGGSRRDKLTAHLGLAFAEQGQGQVRELGQVGHADGAEARHHRMDLEIQQVDAGVQHRRRNPRAAA